MIASAPNLLGDFLRARRQRLTPDDVGLVDHGRRRAPYYARLEQGYDRHPSSVTIAAIARALQLDEPARAHLRQLAGPVAEPPPVTETIAPGLAEMLSGWSATPAVVIGRHRDVLATTPVAALLNPAYAIGTNLLRHTFLDPGARRLYRDWEEIAAGAVAGLRASAGADPDDERLARLVAELSARSGDFARLWDSHDVRPRTTGAKRLENPLVGELTIGYETFGVTAAAGQTLFVFHAAVGTPDAQALARLTHLAAATTEDPLPARDAR